MVKKLFRISRWQQLSIAPSVDSVQMHRLVAGDEFKEKGHLARGFLGQALEIGLCSQGPREPQEIFSWAEARSGLCLTKTMLGLLLWRFWRLWVPTGAPRAQAGPGGSVGITRPCPDPSQDPLAVCHARQAVSLTVRSGIWGNGNHPPPYPRPRTQPSEEA